MPEFRQQLILLKPMHPGVSGYARLQSERGRLLAQLNARGLELCGVVGACDKLLGLFLEFDQIINQTHVFPFVSRAPRLPRRLPPSDVAKTRPGSVTKNRPRACALPKDG